MLYVSICTNGPFTNRDDLDEMTQNVANQCLHCLFILWSDNDLKMSPAYSVFCLFETSLPDASIEVCSLVFDYTVSGKGFSQFHLTTMQMTFCFCWCYLYIKVII